MLLILNKKLTFLLNLYYFLKHFIFNLINKQNFLFI